MPVLAHMAGALYAIALAGILPDRIASILSVAGAVPMVKSWQFTGMSMGHRIAGLTARHAPVALPLLIGGGIRILRQSREDVMLQLYLRDARHDSELVRDPEFLALMIKRFRFVTCQGHPAFATDVILVSSDWSALMSNVTCPLTLVHGVHDRVVLIDGVREFADKYESKLVVSDRSGQLILLADPALVFDALDCLISGDNTAADCERASSR